MKKLLIIVDYQNDFIDGKLGFPEAIEIKYEIIKKIAYYRNHDYDIIFTLDTHNDDYLKTEEGINLPVNHCIKGSKGHEIESDILSLKSPKDKVFEKPTFPSLDMGNYLSKTHYDYVELCGLVSNICVISNAIIIKSALPNAHIVVDAKATKSFDKDLHEKSLDVMQGLHIEVINR